MDEWGRAIAFMRAVDERAADEVVSFPYGRALVNRRLRLVYDLNYLIADRVADVDAVMLAAEAERIQGSFGLSFRRVNVDDQHAAGRLASGFVALGFAPERFVVMAHHRPPDRTAATTSVREIDWTLLGPAREREVQRKPWARNDELVRQIMAKQQLTARRTPTRYFGAIVDGRIVSSCELRTDGDTAQVETVETLLEYRNHGLARAVVSVALESARGCALIFLVADAADWPQMFYARLGFDPVGIESRFLRATDA